MKQLKSFTMFAASILIFILFFNGYSSEGPARSKFKKLGEGTVDLTQDETTPDIDFMKDVRNDKRLKEWALWWNKCSPGFSIDSMEDIGQAPFYEERIDFAEPAKLKEGPNGALYEQSPDGRYLLNPYFKRMFYKKEGDGWQPYVEIPCGAALYDLKNKIARNIMNCSSLEGVDSAFWKGSGKIVLMGYTSVSRQMNVECETVESCITPTVWVVDFKSGLMSEHHGPVTKRKSCEQGGYLKVKFPKAFGVK